MPRTVAIGDIHGCAAALEAILAAIAPQPSDTLVTLGDYIDRGPESRRVIDLLLAASERCQVVPLLGNHEIMLLCAREDRSQLINWLSSGGQQTLASYPGGIDAIPNRHWEFLEGCQTYHESERHFFVHANYDPSLPLDEQPDDLLYWTHLSYFTPRPHDSGKIAIVGHTPQAGGKVLDLGHLICLDTCCFGGGWLTALDVNSGQLWQANQEGMLRQ